MLNPQATTAIRELRAKVMRAAAAPMPRNIPFEPEIIEVVLGPDALIHRVGYARDVQPGTAWHHLVVSLSDYPERLPSPDVISELMDTFEFVWKLRGPREVPPIMAPGDLAVVRSARELPLVYRIAEAPGTINIVEPLIPNRPRREQG
jgi:hypothetical protein